MLQSFQFVMKIAYATTAGNCLIDHGTSGHFLHVLTEIADRESSGYRYFTVIGSFFAHDHAEKCGLPRSIRSYQAYLFAWIKLKGSVHEDKLPAILFIDIRKRNHPCFQANRNQANV